MHKFVEFFQKTTVFKRMHLGLNPIGDAGAEHIVEALKQNKSESVKEVYMDNTCLTEKGKRLIREAGAMREDLTVSDEVNASVYKGRERFQEEIRKQ
jgi:hypothetical protein